MLIEYLYRKRIGARGGGGGGGDLHKNRKDWRPNASTRLCCLHFVHGKY